MIKLIATPEDRCTVHNGSYRCTQPASHTEDVGLTGPTPHVGYFIGTDGLPKRAEFKDKYSEVKAYGIAATLSTPDLKRLRSAQQDVTLAEAGEGDVLYCIESAHRTLHRVLGGYDE